MSDECIELKNIKYKSMLLDPNGFNSKKNKSSNIKSIDEVIEMQNKEDVFLKPWSKLDKVSRLKKLREYVDILVERDDITQSDVKPLYSYLKQCLERKKLQRIKDVTYDSEKGVITNIPGLIIKLTEKRKFTLKNNDKKTSTLKNLTNIKRRKKRPTSKNSKSKLRKSQLVKDKKDLSD